MPLHIRLFNWIYKRKKVRESPKHVSVLSNRAGRANVKFHLKMRNDVKNMLKWWD